jgi:hypothetical protein
VATRGRSPSMPPRPRCGPGWCRWARVVPGSPRTGGSRTCSAPGPTTPTESFPHFQHLSVDDRVRLTPDPYLGLPGQFMTVVELRRPHALVFRQTLPNGGTGSWTFELRRQGPEAIRLLARRRGDRPSLFDRVMVPGYMMMDRGVLLGIRRRAEAGVASGPMPEG